MISEGIEWKYFINTVIINKTYAYTVGRRYNFVLNPVNDN